jgi:hypothetical protein
MKRSNAAAHPRRDSLVRVFFYGLFMDQQVVRDAGVVPTVVGPGTVSGFALRIGRRAVLVPEPAAVTEGVVMDLAPDDVEKLYADSTLAEYAPQPVVVVLEGGQVLDAVCYNAPYEPGERDDEYARRLRDAARRAGLSDAYVASLE